MNFDEYAKNWDTDERINRAKVIANEIINATGTNENYSVMEFGCGTGLVSFNIYDKFKKVTLIDTSKGMIDILDTKISKYKIDNMITKHLDISKENSLNDKFDVIYSSMVLHHIKNIYEIINVFYQLLNNNGYLCIVDLNEENGSFHKEHSDFNGHNGFNQEELKKILISVGFNDIESNTFFNGEKIIEEKKIDYTLFLMKARKA
jgi:ubiquinone/menaquinone biosynthesis C-methylase UbiE